MHALPPSLPPLLHATACLHTHPGGMGLRARRMGRASSSLDAQWCELGLAGLWVHVPQVICRLPSHTTTGRHARSATASVPVGHGSSHGRWLSALTWG